MLRPCGKLQGLAVSGVFGRNFSLDQENVFAGDFLTGHGGGGRLWFLVIRGWQG